jgi:hypothetical protein
MLWAARSRFALRAHGSDDHQFEPAMIGTAGVREKRPMRHASHDENAKHKHCRLRQGIRQLFSARRTKIDRA